MSDTLIKDLIKDGPVVTDGAWGTELQARGLTGGRAPELWNVEAPESVGEVARSYVAAGSRVIITNSFGGSRLTLDRHGMGDRVAELNSAAVKISLDAAGDKAKVFASIGPTGVVLALGDVDPEEVAKAFAEQAAALAEAGADALVIETMSDLQEATLATEAAKATGLPVVASMTYDSGPDRDHTMMGVVPEAAAEALAKAGADVIGSNCGQGIDGFIPIAKRLRAATGLPLWIKANAGLPHLNDDGETVFDMGAEEFVSFVPALVDAGADFIGGCCGTTPAFIEAVAKTLKS